MVRTRVTVEFVGGPADGTRVRAVVEPETGRPAELRIWRHVLRQEGLPPVVIDILYELREAPDDRDPFWRYVLPGSSEVFGFDPEDDPDDTAQER